tara:strand:+ start:1079 stop:1399 length:321 start_codon:yes stop_codon:yes gene_type:complete
MRKIESDLLAAFRLGREFKSGNTTLENTDHGQVIRLHGNKIAQLDGSALYLTSAGRETSTTKSRLNAILSYLVPGGRIYSKNFIWHLDINNYVVKFQDAEGQPIHV